jgi:dTDP-4-dehydrorhamnose 3,5-epimerase
VFRLRGRDPDDVTGVSTEDYFAHRRGAPRPRHSMLDLSRLEATGFVPKDAGDALRAYVAALPPAP